VLDEAYHEYITDPDYPDGIAEHAARRPNVAVLRTFSKVYGLAGLRVGYMVAPAPVVADTGRCRHWFDVTDLAHLAAAASLDDPGELIRRRDTNAAGRSELMRVVREAGTAPLESHGNFVFADVGDGPGVAAELARHGVLVRSLEAFGAPTAIRITVGPAAELAAFSDALHEVIAVTPVPAGGEG
jgi:histidinol-phosphate aminotransferase